MAAAGIPELITSFENHENIEYTVCYWRLRAASQCKGTVVLLHGFPNSKYQFRHVVKLLAAADYDVIAPDWPVRKEPVPVAEIRRTFEKSYVGANIGNFLHSLDVIKPIHLVAHDMGAQVAVCIALQSRSTIATLAWGEAIILGIEVFQSLQDTGKLPWHFKFHSLADLPEAMIAGKEVPYIKHFFDTGCATGARRRALSEEDLAVYVEALKKPGALEQSLAMYRTMPQDIDVLKRILATEGRSALPVLIVNGSEGFIKNTALRQAEELHSPGTYKIDTVREAGHYIAEEAPEELVQKLLEFWGSHEQRTSS